MKILQIIYIVVGVSCVIVGVWGFFTQAMRGSVVLILGGFALALFKGLGNKWF